MLTKSLYRSEQQMRRRQGAVLVLMLLLLPVALLMAAFAVNIAYIELSRTELIVATDAATRAGGRELIKTDDQAIATARAKELAQLNLVAGEPLALANSDLQFGQSRRASDSERFTFTANSQYPNALRITAHRDSSNASGPIALLMPSVLGKNSVDALQTAVSTQMEVDVGLVIDRSGSMAYAANEVCNPSVPPANAPPGWSFGDPAPPICRWRDLVASVDVFLTELSDSPGDELVSMSSYSNSALTDASLTSSYTSIGRAMKTRRIVLRPVRLISAVGF